MSMSMRGQRFTAQFVFLLLILTCRPLPTDAADRPQNVAGARSAVDQVRLRNGTSLRGMLFGGSDKPALLLVSADWLKAAHAKLFESQQARTMGEHAAALEQLSSRLKTELARERPDAVTAFLKQQWEDAQTELKQAEAAVPEFVWLPLVPREIERIEPATAERRQLLAWAWTERLERAETRNADDLQRELKARAVAPVGWPLSLIERLPACEQSDGEWAARLALIDYALDRPLDFQGTSDLLVRADRGAKADIGSLLVGLLRQQLQSQLGDLFNEPRAVQSGAAKNNKAALAESLKPAIQTAEAERRSAFRVTRVQPSDDLQSAAVTTQFVVKLPSGSWESVFQHSERADAKQARPDIEKRIQDDPQVKSALELTRQLGVSAEGQIQQAIRFGAATMSAQQACDREFGSFRDACLKSLAKPPLRW